jgi:cation diffusion facilitator CzcD-associated flavoprotein CzcO
VAQMLETSPPPTQNGNGAGPSHFRFAIVGSGFGGMGMAIKLKQAGIEDFVVLDRDSDVGGTWHANTYPGCQCDIPSHLYSFSFAPNPNWSRTYATQPEILEYLRGVADRFGIRPHVRLECELTSAAWDDEANRWRIETSKGPLTAETLITAPGGLSAPQVPAIAGLDEFEGKVVHTARWDDDYDFTGKRVAVVGTGASAIQAVPMLQKIVKHLTLFQRTPPWIMPHVDRPISDKERRVYRRFPAFQRFVRSRVYWTNELRVPLFVYRPGLLKIGEQIAKRHMARSVADPELRRKLTPTYRLGCKRVLPSNKWYPALVEPNVDVAFGGLTEVRGNSVVTPEGEEREVDAIVFATGFHVTDIPIADMVRGREGKSLGEVWQGSPQMYRGSTVPGFPNLFFLAGYNTGLGHNSIVFMIESQLNYVMDAIRKMDAQGANRVEVRPEVVKAFNDRLQERMPRTVWNTGGCSSWYLDRNGKNTTMWPDFTWRFWQETKHFDADHYELTAKRPAAEAVAV